MHDSSADVSDPQQLARSARLSYVTDKKPGYKRVPEGDHFSYRDPDGKKVTDEALLERFKKLVLPPAWKDVWICSSSRGHLQATGIDSKGRKQYRYHTEWHKLVQESKFDKLVTFGGYLPTLRETIQGHLKDRAMTKQKVMATIVALLESTLIRIGNDQYAKENNSFGLTTMRNKHVKITPKKVIFDFRGKSGVDHMITITDPKLVKIIKACRDIPGYELFQYEDDEGHHEIHSGDINEYLHSLTNDDITAKDFRTWGGTVLAAELFHTCEPCETEAELTHNTVETIKQVASHLGNRPATCRKYYIHPLIPERYLGGKLVDELSAHIELFDGRKNRFFYPFEFATVELVKASHR